MAFTIPDHLVDMFRARRVIPFVGAGMSKNVNYPTWDELLDAIAQDPSLRASASRELDIPVEILRRYTDDDRLRLAEYFWLAAGKQMGLLRQVVERSFPTGTSPLTFGGYADLVNLGAPLIYTTNFDDLIERAHRELDVSVQVIRTSRDIARSNSSEPQIIKYHGDTADDSTLVLTESSYYRRLNFESPLDLKFRADLLGRSVLFLGYSFSDLNIRVIWFRLLDMMRGVEAAEIPTSYVVSFLPNPIQEALYKDAGIETIVLDPTGAATSVDFPELIKNFLYELSGKVVQDRIPGTDRPPFASGTLLEKTGKEFDGVSNLARFRHFASMRAANGPAISRLAHSRIRASDHATVANWFTTFSTPSLSSAKVAATVWPTERTAGLASHRVTARAYQFFFNSDLIQTDVDWEGVFSADIGEEGREFLFGRFDTEFGYHEQQDGFDSELFLVSSLLLRMAAGDLGATPKDKREVEKRMRQLEKLYPGARQEIERSGFEDLRDVALEYTPEEPEWEEDEDED